MAQAVAFHTDVERDLAIAYEKRGNVHRLMGNRPNAEASYRGALGRFERLFDADPSNAGAVRSLAISEEKLALMLADGGAPFDEALRLLQGARGRHGALMSRDASNAQAQCDAARVSELVGDIRRRDRRSGRAACAPWRDSLHLHRGLEVTAPGACASAEAIRRVTAKVGAAASPC